MPERRQISLGELLTEEEIAYLHKVWDQHKGDMMDFMDALKPWFKDPARMARLNAKGMVPEYAAYAIPYFFAQAKEAEAASQTDDIVSRIMGQGGDPSRN